MKERKPIDRLYQEKFKDFEASPNEAVWKNISNRIQSKKKRRILPLWSKIAGIAAMIAILFGVGSQFYFNNSPSVVDTESSPFTEPEPENSPVQVANEDNPTTNKASEDAFFQNEKTTTPSQSLIANTSAAINPEQNFSTAQESFTNSRQQINSVREILLNLPIKGKSLFVTGEIDQVSSLTHNNFNSDLEDNPLFKLEKQKAEEQLITDNETSRKMKVSTFAAPIYFNGIGNGNSIDPQFSDNRKEGEVTMSYGVQIAYAVNDNFKIRSGVSRVAMSYNTMDIAYNPSVDPVALRNVDYSSNAQLMQVQDSPPQAAPSNSFAPELNSVQSISKNGYLNQRLGFIELPLELEFAILKKRLGINIIGGASTLFLDENSVSVNSGDFSTHLGESNNLNEVSFSTNIGLGMDYKLSKTFQFNLEPMFKYQLNTFNSGDLKPYYLGIYTGFSYKF